MPLDPSTLCARTAAGDAELAAPRHGLAIAQRRLLSLLDRPTPLDELAGRPGMLAERLEKDLARLAEHKLVALHGPSVPAPTEPRPMAAPVRAPSPETAPPRQWVPAQPGLAATMAPPAPEARVVAKRRVRHGRAILLGFLTLAAVAAAAWWLAAPAHPPSRVPDLPVTAAVRASASDAETPSRPEAPPPEETKVPAPPEPGVAWSAQRSDTPTSGGPGRSEPARSQPSATEEDRELRPRVPEPGAGPAASRVAATAAVASVASPPKASTPSPPPNTAALAENRAEAPAQAAATDTAAAMTPLSTRAPATNPSATPPLAPVPDIAATPSPAPSPGNPEVQPSTLRSAVPPAAPGPATLAVPRSPAPAPAPAQLASAAPTSVPASSAPKRLTPLTREDPAFPREALARGITHGTVRARLAIDASGKVAGVDILDSQPRRVFDRSVKFALERWTFAPGEASRSTEVEVRFDRE